MSFDPSITPLTWRRVGRFAVWSDGTRLPIVSGGDGEDTLTELLARAGNVTEQSDEELAQLDADITAAATALAEGGNVTDEQLEQLEAAGAAVQTIRAEQESRDAAAAERAERAAAALALVRGDSEDEEDDGEATDEEETPPAEDETPPVVEAEAEPEPEQTPEQIAASAPRRRPLTRVAARRPAAAAPRATTPSNPFGNTVITASANAPGITSGSRITSYEELARGFINAINASKGYRGPQAKIPIFTIGRGIEDYPVEQRWSTDPGENTLRVERAQRTIRAAGGLQAALSNGLTAAGGICAPTDVRRDLPGVVATADRPFRDNYFTQFGVEGTGGGIRTLPGPRIEDLDGASSWWTDADDISALDGSPTKPCLVVTCPDDETETIVEAAVMCLRYGNFRAKYFPQQIARWMELMEASHARLAEKRLMAAVSAAKTSQPDVGQTLGTVRDLLAGLDRISAIWDDVHRRPDGALLAIALPRKLRNKIRSDVTRQLPTGNFMETLMGPSDAQIDQLIRARGFEPTWLLEGESGQDFNAQGVAGTLQGWPTTTRTYVNQPGDWLHLGGGTLTLGVMRDTVTTSTNDVQFFAETDEAPHFHGIDSWVVDWTFCSDGSVSATVDIAPCATGS